MVAARCCPRIAKRASELRPHPPRTVPQYYERTLARDLSLPFLHRPPPCLSSASLLVLAAWASGFWWVPQGTSLARGSTECGSQRLLGMLIGPVLYGRLVGNMPALLQSVFRSTAATRACHDRPADARHPQSTRRIDRSLGRGMLLAPLWVFAAIVFSPPGVNMGKVGSPAKDDCSKKVLPL